ncbi:hypothetical protein HKX48_000205 [Thoreauomyces humboldtii]|nr:hypothetical protein HKX48_000205 [Thoreauomyces humboldtii]
MYCRVSDALKILERMQAAGLDPDVSTYGTLMSGFNINGQHEDALGLFAALNAKGARSRTQWLGPDDALACLRWLIAEGHETNKRHWTVLVNGYLSIDNASKAHEMFDEMVALHGPGPCFTASLASAANSSVVSSHSKDIHFARLHWRANSSARRTKGINETKDSNFRP